MEKSDADSIYAAVTSFKEQKPILLILYSSGGSAGAAYLIGKLCRDYCSGKLIIVVPRQAKSAATLLSCVANEIHMGSLSELGPIDPQIGNMPALGLKNAIEHIAELVKQHPKSSDMFARYLSASLDLINLGYYERVAESAVHYAERLLQTHMGGSPNTCSTIAAKLVYGYKDHGFVIDKSEAVSIFGAGIIKVGTHEYDLGNRLYLALSTIQRFAEFKDHDFRFIGLPINSGHFSKKERRR